MNYACVRVWEGVNDVGFYAASGLVSVILQVIVESIVFCYLLICSAIQTYMYIKDRNTLTQKS